jgi:hypothetical protein
VARSDSAREPRASPCRAPASAGYCDGPSQAAALLRRPGLGAWASAEVGVTVTRSVTGPVTQARRRQASGPARGSLAGSRRPASHRLSPCPAVTGPRTVTIRTPGSPGSGPGRGQPVTAALSRRLAAPPAAGSLRERLGISLCSRGPAAAGARAARPRPPRPGPAPGPLLRVSWARRAAGRPGLPLTRRKPPSPTLTPSLVTGGTAACQSP